jgi:hypothetical protein
MPQFSREHFRAGADEKQSVTLNSGSASGTFRLSLNVGGRTVTTTDLAFDATAAAIQTALNTALGTIGNASVVRPGASGAHTFDVTFAGALSGKDVPLLNIYTDVVTPKAGGTFTLSYGGQTTAPISILDNTSAQALLIQQALSSIGSGTVSVQYDTTSANSDTAPRFLISSGTIDATTISANGSLLTNGASVSTASIAGSATSVNEVQTIALKTGTVEGTFTITVAIDGNLLTTSALPFNSTSSAIESALNTALNGFGSVVVARTGTSGSAILTVTFGGQLSGKNIAPVTVNTSTAAKTASGSFTITYGGQTTRAINLLTIATDQARLIGEELQRLSNIGSGNVEVTWDSTSSAQQPRFRVALTGSLSSTVASTFTVLGANLSNATISTSVLTPGKASVGETQRILINVGSESGKFRLLVPVDNSVYQTDELDFEADASEIQAALISALTTVSGEVIVTVQTNNGQRQLDVLFGGGLAGRDLAAIRVLTEAVPPAASGNFTLSFNGQTTSAIQLNSDSSAQAASIQTALRDLSNIGDANLSVVADTTFAGPGTRYVVTFTGNLAGRDVPQISAAYPELAYASLSTGTMTPGRAGIGETQRVRILTSGNNSTFKLLVVVDNFTYETTEISTSAGKAEVQAALSNAISEVPGGAITVTYWSGTELQVRFGGSLAAVDVPTMTGSATSSVTPAVLTQTVEGFEQSAVDPTTTVLVVNYAAHSVEIATGTGTPVELTIDGSLGELTEAAATIRMHIEDDILASGRLLVQKTSRQDIHLLNGDSTEDLELLWMQLQNASLFIGTGATFQASTNTIETTAASGFFAEDAALSLAIATVTDPTPSDPPTDRRKWTGLAATVGTITIVGLSDQYTLAANRIQILANWVSNGEQSTPKADWSVLFPDPNQPLHDVAPETEYSISGSITVDLNGFVRATGGFTYEKTTLENVDLYGDGKTLGLDLLQIRMQNVSLFAGTGAEFDLATGEIDTSKASGFLVDDASLSLAFATVTDPTPENPATDHRKWTGIAASAGRVDVVGLPSEFVIRLEDLRVISNTAKNGPTTISPISWSRVISDVSDPLHGVAGETSLEVTGQITLFLSDFVQFRGGVALSTSSNIEVRPAGSSTTRTVNALTMGLNNLNVFVGDGPYLVDSSDDGTINEQDTPSTAATGLLLENVSLAVGIFTPVSGTGRYYAVSARCSAGNCEQWIRRISLDSKRLSPGNQWRVDRRIVHGTSRD